MPVKHRVKSETKRNIHTSENPVQRESPTNSTLLHQRTPSVIAAPTRDPSLSIAVPSSSKEPPSHLNGHDPNSDEKKTKIPWWKYIYDKENKTYCCRTCSSWVSIIAYSIMYLIFLTTYTLIFLYASLTIIKKTTEYDKYSYSFKTEMLTYPERGIGLTATPTAEHNNPLIWYQKEQSEDYDKYITAIDRLLNKRRKRDTRNASEVQNLGPCGTHPYGYGDSPCVVIKINKQKNWFPKPLRSNTTVSLPAQVRKWSEEGQKLWLYCDGHYPYDKEHLGSIRYYPDPPGFDPKDFPFHVTGKSPLIAVQFSNFTFGVSLTIRCQLWYELGHSTIDFMLYVIPDRHLLLSEHLRSKKVRL